MESKSKNKKDASQRSENLEESTTAFKTYVFQCTDLAIIVEGKRFYVHKEVLKNISPVFKAMLEGNFNERHQEEITLPGKSYSVFKLFLKIVYLRKYEKLTVRNVLRIYPLTPEDQTPITQRCEEIMKKYVSDRSLPISSLRDLVECLCIAERYELKYILDEALTTAAQINPSDMLNYPKYNSLNEKTRLKIDLKRVKELETRLRTAEGKIATLKAQLEYAESYIKKEENPSKEKSAPMKMIINEGYTRKKCCFYGLKNVNIFLKVLPEQKVGDNSDSDSNDSDI